MLLKNQTLFVVKVFMISAIISVFIKNILSNFPLIDKTYLALPIVITPTIIVTITLLSRLFLIGQKNSE